MKKLLSTLIGSSLLATGIISTSATSASAACSVDNIYSGVLTASECYDGTDKNDQAGDLTGWLGNIINGGGPDGLGASTDKVEDYNGGSNDYFTVSSSDGLTGSLTFTQDIDSPFSIVLKGSTGWSAYKFDGVTAGDTFNWTMEGVPLNKGGNIPGLSHASLYLTEGGGVSTPEPSLMIGLAVLGGGLVASRLRKSN